MAEQVNITEEEEVPVVEPPKEEVPIVVPPPKVVPEEDEELSGLQKWNLDHGGMEEPLEQEELYEDEEEDTYKTGSFSDYALQGLAGVIETAENMGEIFNIPEMHKALNETVETFNVDSDKLVFNFKGFKNYDPNRDAISFMSDEEWDELYSKDKVSFMPSIGKSDSPGATLTRNLTKVVAGLIPAAKIAKGVKAGAVGLGIAKKAPSSKMVKGLQKYAEFTSVGTLGSVFAFKPYEPRIADDMVGFVKDTPFEVTQPFFEWMEADDSNSEVEERFKIALEAMIIDAALVGVAVPAFSTFFKVFKRERKLAKAEATGAPVEDLQAINDLEIVNINSSDINSLVPPPSLAPIKVEARETIKEVLKSTKELVPVGAVDDVVNKTVLESVSISSEGLQRAIQSIARAITTGDEVGASAAMAISGRRPLINLNHVPDIGVNNVINALSNEIDREARLLGKKILTDQHGNPVPVGQNVRKPNKQTKKEAVSYAQYINNRTELESTHFMALAKSLDIKEKQLFKQMQPDQLMSDQIGSRILAWKMVLDDHTQQFYNFVKDKDLTQQLIAKEVEPMVEGLNNLWNAFSEMPRGLARGLQAQRIQMPKKYTRKSKDGTNVPKNDVDLSTQELIERNKLLEKQFEGRGINKELLIGLRSAMSLAGDPTSMSRNLRKALTSSMKGRRAFLEVYRGLLLTNLKTLTTNFLGNTMETLMIPLSRTIGHMATLNPKGVKEELGFMANMVMSTKKATLAGMDSLIHERNLLDPLRTKSEAFSGEMSTGFYMQMDKVADAGYWHPQNWVPLMVNTAGKVGRASLRVLGAQDEFFKVLTYNGKAISKITKSMPEGLNRTEKKEFIKRNLDLFYDDAGEAIDKDMLAYSRRAAFQEDLEKGLINDLHKAVGRTPELGIFFPFVRTPANLISRALQRTPVANFMSQRTKRMWASGNKEERAEVIGNTIIGTGIFSAALGYSMSGNITGSGPVDPVKNRLWKAAGFKPYHIKIGDTWHRYDRLEPLMLPFIYVSSLHENLYRYNNNPDDLQDAIGVFIAVSAKTLVDRTWLRGLKGVVDGIDSAIANNDYSYVGSSMLANIIPAGINQVIRLSGLEDEESGVYSYRQASGWLEKAMAKLPPSEGHDAVKHNWLTGKPMLIPSGGDFGMDTTTEEPSKYMEELLRFGNNIQGVSQKVGQVKLSSEQYSRLTELTGTVKIEGLTLMEQLEKLMDTEAYDFDEDRIYHPDYPSPQQKIVVKVINTYKEKARMTLLGEDEVLHHNWQKEAYDKAKVGMGMEL